MKESRSLGEQELDALRFLSDNPPLTVGEAAKLYGGPRGLARTTVLTVMERLRAKGYLSRRLDRGVYRYTTRVEREDLLKNLVADFVERSLGGSLSPFVTYLADSGKLTDEEIRNLRRVADEIESDEAERTPGGIR